MATTVANMISDDFGFTFADEADIVTGSKTVTEVTAKADSAQERLDNVMKLIAPFLKNLQASPDQPYLKWPDRANKVKAFETKINAVAKGSP